ncbi:Nicotinate N-methyltransferase 1-like protein [Drosera capensis]
MSPLAAAVTDDVIIDETSEIRNRARLQILELANMISVPMCLNAVVRLNVAEAVWSGEANSKVSAAEIVERIVARDGGADAGNLERILRILAAYNVFQEHLESSERRYSLIEIGRALVTDSEGLSYGAYVLQHYQDELMKAWPLVHTAVLDPETEPFVKANCEPAYCYYGKDEAMNELMQKAMAGVHESFAGERRLVDVGGSAGDCLKMILQKYPNIKGGINFDLPEVVAKAPTIPDVTHVGGDIFKSIPSGDAIFMKWILTTWTDDECIEILKNCHKALPAGGKLIACEPALPEHSDDSHTTRALLSGDIFIMTIYRTKGKHCTKEEYRQLGVSASFPHSRSVHIDYFYTILEFTKMNTALLL